MELNAEQIKLLAPILVLQLILMIIALADLAKRNSIEVLGKNKVLWGVIIILGECIGPIAYLTFGRRK